MYSLDKIFYHFNAHGDVVVLTNTNGSKTKSYSYNAFGVEYNESTLDDNPFRYCGEYYDKETQTIYLRARYYNAAQGRFTQEDPIRDGYNWYSYCGGNPVNCVDSTGFSFTKMQDVTDDDGLLEGEPLGLSGGGARAYTYFYEGTSYGSYAIRCQTALYDAQLGGYHSNHLSSAIINPSVYIVPGAETVTDDMAVIQEQLEQVTLYRSIGDAEYNDILKTGKLNISESGMDCKQFGFDLTETQTFGQRYNQTTIVSVKIPNTMITQFYTETVDAIIFRHGTLTVYDDQMDLFNDLVNGSFHFIK